MGWISDWRLTFKSDNTRQPMFVRSFAAFDASFSAGFTLGISTLALVDGAWRAEVDIGERGAIDGRNWAAWTSFPMHETFEAQVLLEKLTPRMVEWILKQHKEKQEKTS